MAIPRIVPVCGDTDVVSISTTRVLASNSCSLY